MPTTRYTDAGVSPRTNVYAERQMLKHAMPVVILDKFGMMRPMPKNKTQVIKFRRLILGHRASSSSQIGHSS